MPEPKYPDVIVQLTGEDGNAFFIMGRVLKAMKRAGISDEECRAYTEHAMSGDYDNLLRVTQETVTVE